MHTLLKGYYTTMRGSIRTFRPIYNNFKIQSKRRSRIFLPYKITNRHTETATEEYKEAFTFSKNTMSIRNLK